MSSNIAQNYPYSSESETDRAAAVVAVLSTNEKLAGKVKAESVGLPPEDRWWVWKCPTSGCRGLLHAVGFARNAHAVYTLCDTCSSTYLR